jgi:hypothetical protein
MISRFGFVCSNNERIIEATGVLVDDDGDDDGDDDDDDDNDCSSCILSR